MRRWLFAVAVMVVAGAGAALALADSDQFPAGSQSRTGGPVAATLSWSAGADGPSNPMLKITRDGVVAFDQPVADVVCATCEFSVLGNSDVKIADLDGDGEPEVLIHSLTGIVDGLVNLGIYRYDPATGSYDRFVTQIPLHADEINSEVRDFHHDGHYVIVGGDMRFAKRFAGEVTWYPPIIYAYSAPGGTPTLTDVTRKYPEPVRSDAALALDAVTHPDAGEFGTLEAEINHGIMADYVADEYELGHGAAALKELDTQIKLGRLGGPKSAHAYRVKLLALLHTLGYR
jgi:hypothetical protein